jgi:hypothetical protein
MGNIISLKLHGKWDIAVAHLSSQFKSNGLSFTLLKSKETKDEVQLKKLGLKIIEIQIKL